jgi:hypothetical protein
MPSAEVTDPQTWNRYSYVLNSDDRTKGLKASTIARVFAVERNYGYQPAILALGTKPLSHFDDAVEQADSAVENERKRILSKQCPEDCARLSRCRASRRVMACRMPPPQPL